jgi:predicted nicotinamide N-methyase
MRPETAREEETCTLGAIAVRLARPADLTGAVDAAALLGAGGAPEPPYWMHLWPGATALARLVAAAPEIGPGTEVLELGCGLALPSLVAARRGARVVATDWLHAPLTFARRSAALNATALRAVQMDWRAPALRAVYDVCLMADVAYDPGAEEPLVRALETLLRPATGVAWLVDSVNTYRATLLERLRTGGFWTARRDAREVEDGRPVWVRIIEARRAG